MLSRRRFLTLSAGVTTSVLISACVAPTGAEAGSTSGSAAPGAAGVEVSYWALEGENDGNNLTRAYSILSTKSILMSKLLCRRFLGTATMRSIRR